jgi:hypothetical protein
MVAPRLRFHQPVFAVFCIQMERTVNQNGRGCNAENDTYPLIYARHVHDDKHDKQTQQPACEYEKVLRFETFKFRRMTYPPVD